MNQPQPGQPMPNGSQYGGQAPQGYPQQHAQQPGYPQAPQQGYPQQGQPHAPQHAYPQQGQPPYGQQPYGQQPNGYAQGGQYSQGAPRAPYRPVGAIITIIAVAVCFIAIFLPWNLASDDGFFGHETWNGFDQMNVNIDNGRIYGTLMMVSFVTTFVSGALLIVAALARLFRVNAAWVRAIAGIFGVLLFIATAGMIIGYLALGAADFIGPGTWVYGISGAVALIGAIGIASKKY